MNTKRKIGLVILIIGIIFIGFSVFINKRVEEGRGQIASAQKKTDQASDLFSLNPVTKELGKGVTGSIQEKIDEGKQQADAYAKLATWLTVGGIIFLIVGGGSIVFGGKKRRR